MLVGFDPESVRVLRTFQLAVAVPVVAVAVAVAARHPPLPGAAILGIPLIFASVSLTAYYYAFLVFLTLAERDARWWWPVPSAWRRSPTRSR